MEKAGNFGAKVLFFLSPFMGLLFMRWLFDNDLWFILGSGRFVLENGFPYTEPFTMHENINFVLEQWLTDVIYWVIYSNFGAEVFLTFVFFIGFCMLFVYEKICRYLTNGNIAVSKVATLVVGVFVVPNFLLTRPQILSTLVFLGEIFVLLKYAKTNDKKYLIAIPVFSLLTVNLHCAVWPLIFILMLPFFAAFLARRYTKIDSGYLGEEFDVKPLIFAATVSFFIAFINPYGIKAMLFLFTSYDPGIHAWISEIKPPTFEKNFRFFFIILFFGFFTLAKKKIPLYLILLFLGLGLLGLMSVRNIFWFYMVGTLIFPFALKDYRFKLFQTEWGFYKILPFILFYFFIFYRFFSMETLNPMPIIYMVYFACLFISLAFLALFYKADDRIKKAKGFLIVILPSLIFIHLSFQSMYSASDYKYERFKDTVDLLLAENDIKDIRLFTGFNTGSYPEFRGIKCYIDGRPEIFAPKNSGLACNIIGEYFDVTGGVINYKDFIEKYDFTHLLVEKGDGLLFYLTPYCEDLILLREEVDEKGWVYEPGEVYARLYKVKK
ncbi:MAG: hypothetical protein IKN12_08310 [Selenomonadaceae bacterium]|nr:hypothetical protein [Selenomonadaceae bacterium]